MSHFHAGIKSSVIIKSTCCLFIAAVVGFLLWRHPVRLPFVIRPDCVFPLQVNIVVCIAVVRNHFFSEITPAKRNRLGRNFTGRHRLDTLLWKLLALSAKGAKAAWKNFVTKTTHRFTFINRFVRPRRHWK